LPGTAVDFCLLLLLVSLGCCYCWSRCWCSGPYHLLTVCYSNNC